MPSTRRRAPLSSVPGGGSRSDRRILAGGAAVVLVAAVVLIAAGVLSVPGGSGGGRSMSRSSASAAVDPAAAASSFLDRYVDPDGRVVRHDQGGDTVSEGQAYALLLATSIGDEAVVNRIWPWTKDHLQRPDGLLAWHWAGGAVVDHSSAADADLLTAYALVTAGSQFHDARLRAEGLRMGTAVLDAETATTALGRVLRAGSWTTSSPWQVNPSYDVPFAEEALGRASHDPRWNELRTGDAAVLAALLGKSALPPDWAQVHDDGTVDIMPTPGAAVQFGLDAARIVVQAAASCDAADRRAAVRTAPVLVRDAAQVRGVYDLGGGAVVPWQHPLALVAAAGAAHATGDLGRASSLITSAHRLDLRQPTYYGSAWVALGSTLLQPQASTRLRPCAGGGTS